MDAAINDVMKVNDWWMEFDATATSGGWMEFDATATLGCHVCLCGQVLGVAQDNWLYHFCVSCCSIKHAEHY